MVASSEILDKNCNSLDKNDWRLLLPFLSTKEQKLALPALITTELMFIISTFTASYSILILIRYSFSEGRKSDGMTLCFVRRLSAPFSSRPKSSLDTRCFFSFSHVWTSLASVRYWNKGIKIFVKDKIFSDVCKESNSHSKINQIDHKI